MEWLRAYRDIAGKSQTEMARDVGVTQPSYCNIENGVRKPSVKTAKKIAEVLGFAWTLFYADGTDAEIA